MFSISPIRITTKKLRPVDTRFSITHRQELVSGFDQAKLASASANLIGAGGIGGEVGEGLCRKGIGRLRIFDHDIVEHTNLNRQHFFKADIGKNKAHQLAHNLAEHCHAGTILEGHSYSFEDALALEVDLLADLVVCGVDNTQARIAVSEHYRPLNVPVIFIAVDLLAECGHVFVQQAEVGAPCFGCAFPNSLSPKKAPCFVPSSKDVLKVVSGLSLYAIDSLLMNRHRNWNFRRVHLAGYAPDVLTRIERQPSCPLCADPKNQPERGSSTGYPGRDFSGSVSP